jgi:ABC-2 type transport system ATP-binding protein
MISVQALTRRFGDFTAVAGIDLEVRPGEIFGFLGPNGAGKSTTIKMLSTLLRPTSGRAVLGGHDVVAEPAKVRESIGMVFQDPSLDDRLTGAENLRFHAMLYGVPRAEIEGRIRAVLRMVDLDDRRDTRVKLFSGGMKRRLEIARGFLHHPRVLFLDEPTIGLDPQTRTTIWEHVRRLRDEIGLTVFMTTHYMDEAEICDRIAIIDHGRIAALDTPEALKRQVGGDTVILTGEAGIESALKERFGVDARRSDSGVFFQVRDGAQFVPRVVSELHGRVQSIQVKQPSLDDVFLKMTGRAIREEEGSALDEMREGRKLWSGRW